MYTRRTQPLMLDYMHIKLLESASRLLSSNATPKHVSRSAQFRSYTCCAAHPQQPSKHFQAASQRFFIPFRKPSVPYTSAAAQEEAKGTPGAGQNQSLNGGESNSSRCDLLDDMMAGSSVTLQQWVFHRYAIMSTIKRSELLGMLHRRHELAMALVARSHLDSLEASQLDSAKHSSSQGSQQQPSSQESTEQHSSSHASCPGEDSVRDSSNTLKSPRKRSGRLAEKRGTDQHPQSFAMHPQETFKDWVERLCKSLPVVVRTRPYRAHVVTTKGVSSVAVQPSPPLKTHDQLMQLVQHNLVLPGTGRVVYAPHMPFTQFVAAVGLQLLVQASRSKDESMPKASIMVECLLAIEAHSIAPLLLDADTKQPATREKVEQVVQMANASRGVDYRVDRNDQQALSLLAKQLHKVQAGKDKLLQKAQQGKGREALREQTVEQEKTDAESKPKKARKLRSAG